MLVFVSTAQQALDVLQTKYHVLVADAAGSVMSGRISALRSSVMNG